MGTGLLGESNERGLVQDGAGEGRKMRRATSQVEG